MALVGDHCSRRVSATRGCSMRGCAKIPKSDYSTSPTSASRNGDGGKGLPEGARAFQPPRTRSPRLKSRSHDGQAPRFWNSALRRSAETFEQVAGSASGAANPRGGAVPSRELEARQGRWAEAIAHYQRRLVAYQNSAVDGEGVVRSAIVRQTGQASEAIAHLRSCCGMRSEGFSRDPQAKKLLAEWGASNEKRARPPRLAVCAQRRPS